MKRFFAFIAFIVLGLSLVQSQQKWVTAYYCNWQFRPFASGGYYNYFGIPPQNTKFSGITHVIQFGDVNVTTTYPYFGPIGGMADSVKWTYGTSTTGVNYRDSLVKYTHLAGTKVLTCIQQAQTGAALLSICGDSVKVDDFCTQVVLYCKRNKYDGTDINWEHNEPTPALSSILLRRLRYWFTTIGTWNGQRAVITLAPPSGSWGVYDPVTCNATVDQINPQLYSNSVCWYSGCNSNWFVNPLTNGVAGTDYPLGFEAHSYESRGPLQWIAQGFAPSIMGAGVASFARCGVGSDQLFGGQNISGCFAGGIDDIGYGAKDKLLDPAFGGKKFYDPVRHASAIYGMAPVALDYQKLRLSAGQKYWFMYADIAKDIPDMVAWVKQKNLGGVMIYAMASEGDPSKPFDQRYPVTNAIVAAMGGIAPPPIDTVIPPPPPPPVKAGCDSCWKLKPSVHDTFRISIHDTIKTIAFIHDTTAGRTDTFWRVVNLHDTTFIHDTQGLDSVLYYYKKP